MRVGNILLMIGPLAAIAAPGPVTYNKDVLPILQAQCQECHRPGEIAPMSFLTYKDTRPWAKAMKDAILLKKMPPWFMDPNYGHFSNERKLSEEQIRTIVAWVDSGSPEGDEKDKPPPVHFAEGWSIGKPDMVIEFPHELQIPASGVIDQSNLLVKVNFPRDAWIKAAEVRPSNPRVVHHMKAWIRPPGSAWMKDAPQGVLYKPSKEQYSSPAVKEEHDDRPRPAQEILAKYNPGVNAQEFSLNGAAKFIAAGSDIVFECHYTTTGKPETDRSRVAIIFADQPPEKRYVTLTGVDNHDFVIPPHAAHYEVKAESTILKEAELAWVQPHMHLRAKDYQLTAYYPTGESQILMKGNFDFNWQLGYNFSKPVVLPKGTRLETITHFDNSENNAYNPNPNIEVRYGPQTTDEMDVSFMGFIIDVKDDPAKLFPRRGRPITTVE